MNEFPIRYCNIRFQVGISSIISPSVVLASRKKIKTSKNLGHVMTSRPGEARSNMALWGGPTIFILFHICHPLPFSPVSCIYTHTTVIEVIFWNSMFVKKCHTTCTDSRFIMHNSDLYHLIKHKLLYGTVFFSGPVSQKFNSSSRSRIFMSRKSSFLSADKRQFIQF